MRRAFFLLAAALVFSGMAVVAALFGLNFFLNTGLLLLINRQPERLWMGWRSAWTWDAQGASRCERQAAARYWHYQAPPEDAAAR